MVAVLATAMAAFAGCEEDAGNNGNGSTNNGGGTASKRLCESQLARD